MLVKPRAVLLGWGNATRSQLVVYERLHRARGLEVSCVIPDTLAGLTRPEAHREAVEPLARELAAEGGARPIIVHQFSDNGFIGWAALLLALSATEGGRRARDAIRGVIQDSSPGLWAVRGPLDFARRFALGMTPAVSRAARMGARERLPFVTPLLAMGFMGYQLVCPKAVRAMKASTGHVVANQPRCSHLFLYGEADVLVPPRDIRAWIAKQRERGLDVEDHAFAGARHVALFPKDPKRYRAVITAFVERALSARESEGQVA